MFLEVCVHYDLMKPCSNCPFLKEGGVRLTEDRAAEIAAAMLDSQGSTFACHKTTIDAPDDEDGSGLMAATPKSKHCAGALIFAEKNGKANQMMRIAERLRMYDAGKLMAQAEVVATVFDTLKEMLRANREAFGGDRRGKSSEA